MKRRIEKWTGNGRQKIGERVVWKTEKVNKWEMPSYTHAGKYTDPPSHSFDTLKPQSRKRVASAERGLQKEHFNAPSQIEIPHQVSRILLTALYSTISAAYGLDQSRRSIMG